ncbi:hypothetical protein E2562_020826 [Oryza meyeriana var. granulata]|uniref:Pentacotripeptide-repeat region of PRORP domain-containing protein n=1 Tax=Oryza meyeriana var. granulata TaxID=110450 RepID=A0A6G1CGM7_9ORYZ|nr:hypothetical protein E2562_020826 [Oryza meyeriana var. granulata]
MEHIATSGTLIADLTALRAYAAIQQGHLYYTTWSTAQSSAPLLAHKMLRRLPLRLAPPLAGIGGAVPNRVLRGACTAAPASSRPSPDPLSPSDLDAISALLPRLISAGNVPAASRLLTAALLLPGSTERLPFSPLAAHLASMPTLTPAFALLTAIRHHPLRPSPLPLATPLLGHLLSRRRPREAASVVRWLCRPDSPQRPDSATYAVAVAGLCRLEDPKNALAALREMAKDGIRISVKLRESVRDAMLQDARIEEAWALEAAMKQPDSSKLAQLVEKLLQEWED